MLNLVLLIKHKYVKITPMAEYLPTVVNDRVHTDPGSVLLRDIPIANPSINRLVGTLEPDVATALDMHGYEQSFLTGTNIHFEGAALMPSMLYKGIFDHPYSLGIVELTRQVDLMGSQLTEARLLLQASPNGHSAQITVAANEEGTSHTIELQQAAEPKLLEEAASEELTPYMLESILAELLLQADLPRKELLQLSSIDAMMAALITRSKKPIATSSAEFNWLDDSQVDTTLKIEQFSRQPGLALITGMRLGLATSRRLAEEQGILRTSLAVEGGKLRKPVANITVGITETSLNAFPKEDRNALMNRTVLATNNYRRLQHRLRSAIQGVVVIG